MKFQKLIKKIKKNIHVLDIVIGAFFIIIAISLLLLFHRKNEYVDIRVRVTDQDVLYANNNPRTWYANQFEVGDVERDELGGIVGKITGVETFNISEDSKVVYLDISLRAVYNKRSQLYSAQGTNLIFGNTLRLNFSKTFFNSLITEAPDRSNQNDYSEEQKTIVVIERGVTNGNDTDVNSLQSQANIEPQVLSKIKSGDVITDSNGRVLAEVKDIVITPALRITQNDRGDLLSKLDPYYKDATITLTILVKKYKSDEFIFDIIPLKIGSKVPLNFSYESIWPTLIEVK
jgi:hypothetical protein